MTIVDKIHGAEIVTDKGKVFKFDAAECLIHYYDELESVEGYQLLSNYFETPEAFVPMEEATFLISENIPSPMGAFLTAFKTNDKALEVRKIKGGELYNWEELQKQLKR
jgi:copper chaperone NosL